MIFAMVSNGFGHDLCYEFLSETATFEVRRFRGTAGQVPGCGCAGSGCEGGSFFYFRNNCPGSISDRRRKIRYWQLCVRSRAHLLYV